MRQSIPELHQRIADLESLVRSMAGQLNINWTTGLIAPTADGTFYQTFAKKGPLLGTATTGPFRVPVDCTLARIDVSLTTASSSGSVTARINKGVTDYDTTVTATNTHNSSTPNAALVAGDILTAELTAYGTDAVDLTMQLTFVPT